MTDDEKVELLKVQLGIRPKTPPPPIDLLLAVRLRHLLLFSTYAFDSVSFMRGWGMGTDQQEMVHEADRLSREMRCEMVSMLVTGDSR